MNLRNILHGPISYNRMRTRIQVDVHSTSTPGTFVYCDVIKNGEGEGDEAIKQKCRVRRWSVNPPYTMQVTLGDGRRFLSEMWFKKKDAKRCAATQAFKSTQGVQSASPLTAKNAKMELVEWCQVGLVNFWNIQKGL